MTSTVYKGRTIEIMDPDGNDTTHRQGHKRVLVNGTPQFSFQAPDDFIIAETRRYIDAVEAADERNRQRYAAGAYVPTRAGDYADSWRAAA